MDGKTEQPDWTAPIDLATAAEIVGLSVSRVQHAALDGDLHAQRLGARTYMTTRKDLDAWRRSLDKAGKSGKGRPAKPLPDGYQAPPRRGRPRKQAPQDVQPADERR